MGQWPLLLIGGTVLLGFSLLGFASFKIKLPAVPAFIVMGILAGGFLLDQAKLFSYAGEIGIVLLFFLLGLEYPLHKMLNISKKVWPAGVFDLLLNMGVGTLLAYIMGLGWLDAVVVGAVAYATSSSITIKLLEEKKRLAAPESEFILALLIFEDLVAPMLVSVVASLYLGGAMLNPSGVGSLLVKTGVLIAGAIITGTYFFRKAGGLIEQFYEEDFMPLFAVGMALAYAGIALLLGLSEILGAFLAGVMLSETGRSKELDSIVIPIRNLFLPFFFFWFGTTITFGNGLPKVWLMLVLVGWSVLGKLIVGFYGGRLYGLAPVSALRAGFSLEQRGEFSVIIAALSSTTLRSFSGIYILITALMGMFLFNHAGRWAKKLSKYFTQRSGGAVL